MKIRDNLPFSIRSNQGSARMAAPSVSSRNNSDGGYFDMFRKERTVKTASLCVPHRLGSPYTLTLRSSTKLISSAAPSLNKIRRRRSASNWYNAPKEYPAANTPIQGMSG